MDKARELFQTAGQDFAALKQAAARSDFRPVSLKSNARFEITNTLREVKSHNVVARIEGADPALKNETLIFTAHWDHLGRDPALKGDQIYNGAADNASGVASILEIAHALAQAQPPAQAIDFVPRGHRRRERAAWRQVLRGAPSLPTGSTLADINLDVINLWGPTSDLISIGMGNSTLDDLLVEIARSTVARSLPTPIPKKATTFVPTTSSSPSKECPRSIPRGAGSTLANPPISASESRTNTPPRTITK